MSASVLLGGRPVEETAAAPGARKDAELLQQGLALLSAGKALEAMSWARRLIALDPKNPDGFRLLAKALSRLGRYDEAEKAALEAVRLDPDDPEGYIALAWARLHLKKYQEALEAVDKAILLAPENAVAYVLRALIYEQLGMRDKMIEDLRKAAALDPAKYGEHLRRALAGERLYDPNDPDSYLLLDGLSRRHRLGSGPAAWALLSALCLLASGFVVLQWRRSRTAKAAAPAADKYRVTRRISKTEHADLWEAEDAALGRTVRIRRMKFPRDEAGEKHHARALRDCRLLADLRDPRIETVLEIIELDHELRLVLEAAPWPSAETLGRLPFDKARDILAKACEALAVAHERGLLHRCVTPARVLVSEQGYVGLTDFGCWGGCDLDYRAPETEGGVETPAADVYSLGATLYALLVGSPPYAGDVFARRAMQEFQAPSACAPGVPAAVDSLVRDALHPQAGSRIQSVQAFLERLRQA